MIDVAKATSSLGGLALLKFFPADPLAQAELVSLVCEMADTNDQIDWLVRRARNLWNSWEGPHELRALFCSKFKPRDGIDAFSQLPRFADGIPSEKESMPALAAASQRLLRAPDGISAAQSITDIVKELAIAKDMNRVGPAPKVREIPVRRVTNSNRITEEDIRKAEQECREKRAVEELEGSSV